MESQFVDNYNGPTRLNLLAVICIKDYHYVTFVKSGTGTLSHWVLFDSNPSEEKPKVSISNVCNHRL